MSWYSRYLP